MIWATIAMALREIRRNAMRSFLTMLGIIIGVGSVIALVHIGEGATAQVTSEIKKLGDNLLIVTVGGGRRSASGTPPPLFSLADVQAIRREIKGVAQVAPVVNRSGVALHGNRNMTVGITGTTNDYLAARSFQVVEGRSFSDIEQTAGRTSCMLGSVVKETLFGSENALGVRIRVGVLSCEVVGVLGAKGQSSSGQDQDSLVLMPLRAVQRRLAGNLDVSTVYVTSSDGRSTAAVKEELEQLLRQRRRLAPDAEDNFTVRDMQEIAATAASTTAALTALLGAIGAVSLLVGGIGIMNIMLVSVTERTREIGIRLAIGALAGEVLLQFLVEAVALSMLGGLFGVLLGLLGSYAATAALGVPFTVSLPIVAGAFAFSAVVGVAFGFLPARKAAGLNPIEALRHE